MFKKKTKNNDNFSSRKPENPFPVKSFVDYLSLMDESSDSWQAVHNLDGTYRYVNHGITRILGYEPEELLGIDVYEIIHPDDHPNSKLSHTYVMYNDEASRIEIRFRHKDDDTYVCVEVFSWRNEDSIIVLARPCTQGNEWHKDT